MDRTRTKEEYGREKRRKRAVGAGEVRAAEKMSTDL